MMENLTFCTNFEVNNIVNIYRNISGLTEIVTLKQCKILVIDSSVFSVNIIF